MTGTESVQELDNDMKNPTPNIYRVRDFAEERTRTLYVRLPHRIRDPNEVQELFDGNPRVKLPRQASRACHVIFPTLEEKLKGMENVKDKTMDGKRIIAFSPKTKPMENRIKPKKIVVPKPKPAQKVTQSLFVSNINAKTTIDGLKDAFPGAKSVAMLEINSKGVRSAFIKMESIESAAEYISKEKKTPVVDGKTLFAQIDTRSRKPRRGSKTKNKKLKIYDEDGKATKKKFENLSPKKTAKKTSDPETD